ncbi:UNVERIFIED_CONTAM: hypothetical protein HDU68_001244, partial [Siphonaria sp. JEL0065]
KEIFKKQPKNKMVATRATRSASKRASSSVEEHVEATSPVSKKQKKSLPFKSSDLEQKKKNLNKVAPPKPAPNTGRVPHPKKLEAVKSKLKVVTTTVKTDVVVKASSPSKSAKSSPTKSSPTKAASNPSKSPVRAVSPVKRPRSADH